MLRRPPGTPPPPAPASGEGPPSGPRRWVPIAAVGGGAALVAGVVAVVLLALGGSAGKNVKGASVTRTQALRLLAANGTTTVSRAAPGLFAVVKTGNLSALVPAGWRATAQAASGTARAEFADPNHPSSTLTIVAQVGAGNEHGSALAARRAARSKGYSESSFGRIAFPGRSASLAFDLRQVRRNARNVLLLGVQCQRHAGSRRVGSELGLPQGTGTLQAAAAGAEPLC